MTKKIEEVVIVEGRDDVQAVERALDVDVIATHGFGLSAEIWKQIERVYSDRGIIIFTDPDHAGEEIRKQLTVQFPKAKQAFLDFSEAKSGDKAGIEFAKPEDIERALLKARKFQSRDSLEELSDTSLPAGEGYVYSMEDMRRNGLIGRPNSSSLRRELGRRLSIGYGSAKAFVKKLNLFRISRQEFERELADVRRSFIEKDD